MYNHVVAHAYNISNVAILKTLVKGIYTSTKPYTH